MSLFWNFFGRDEHMLEVGARARRVHSSWLTRALQAPPSRYPVIPLRRVSEGGFSGMMRSEEGRCWAALWWETALLRVDEEA